MNRYKLRQLAKKINHGKPIDIKFVFAPSDHFCYKSNHTLEISSFYHRLKTSDIMVYLTHEIGHMNTIPELKSIYISDYAAEYEANRWALYRLDELSMHDHIGSYQNYLKELAMMEIEDDDDAEYQEAAMDLLQELELI